MICSGDLQMSDTTAMMILPNKITMENIIRTLIFEAHRLLGTSSLK